jgi:hypothetical protein
LESKISEITGSASGGSGVAKLIYSPWAEGTWDQYRSCVYLLEINYTIEMGEHKQKIKKER